MCVLAFAWKAHPRWRLLLVGNRDELHARPSVPLARWSGATGIVAGRDLETGGTWMGASESGRACVVTNLRDPRASHRGVSRGLLVTDFLGGAATAATHASELATDAARYRPFNLLLFDPVDARFVSNAPFVRERRVAAGVHGLSNGDLDAPWPKVWRATTMLREWIEAATGEFGTLLDGFADGTVAPDDALPDTGVGIELERQLSPVFVRGARYGTRATTLIALDQRGVGCIIERRFGPDGVPEGEAAMDVPASVRFPDGE